MTPFEMLRLFGRRDDGGEPDPVTDLARINRRQADLGRPPITPAWLMPGVPRRRK